MRDLSRANAGVALLVIALGAVADGCIARAGEGRAACDERCREKIDFYFCGSNPPRCVRFLYPSCLLCQPRPPRVLFKSLCVAEGGSLFQNCLEPALGSRQNLFFVFESCEPLCSCSDAHSVEASMTGNKVDTLGITRYICRPQ